MMEARKQSGGARAGSIGSPLSPPELGMASDADLEAMIHAGERKWLFSGPRPAFVIAAITH